MTHAHASPRLAGRPQYYCTMRLQRRGLPGSWSTRGVDCSCNNLQTTTSCYAGEENEGLRTCLACTLRLDFGLRDCSCKPRM